MKSKYWIILLAVILAFCIVFATMSATKAPSKTVQIKYGNNTVTVRLDEDQTLTFAAEGGGYNTVTVKDGKIAVTEADCPDHYCMERGFCNSGTPIVCLPHKLVIEFLDDQEIDGLIG